MANFSYEQSNGSRADVQNSGRLKNVALSRGALDLSVLLGRGPSLEVVKAGDPEVSHLTFGILPLTDCAPIVVAHENGFFEKHGIESSVAKFGSWTASRDGLLSGETHAAHMLFGMPVAAAVGKLGTEHRPLVIPWILNRNGQAITFSIKHRELLAAGDRICERSRECRDGVADGLPATLQRALRHGLATGWLPRIHPTTMWL
jgi:nitrate/nitrite transport system substrate-binding protein